MGAAFILLTFFLIPVGIASAIGFAFHKRPWLVVMSLAVAVIAWLIIPESYFYPYPFIDTVRSPQFTQEKFGQIHAGMTKAEVVGLIGEQVSGYSYEEPGPTYCERQTDDGRIKFWDFAWLNATVCYNQNGVVKYTQQFWEQD